MSAAWGALVESDIVPRYRYQWTPAPFQTNLFEVLCLLPFPPWTKPRPGRQPTFRPLPLRHRFKTEIASLRSHEKSCSADQRRRILTLTKIWVVFFRGIQWRKSSFRTFHFPLVHIHGLRYKQQQKILCEQGKSFDRNRTNAHFHKNIQKFVTFGTVQALTQFLLKTCQNGWEYFVKGVVSRVEKGQIFKNWLHTNDNMCLYWINLIEKFQVRLKGVLW